MKTTLFCILLLLSGIVSAQTIDHPPFKARSGSISNITRIECTPENTRVYIHAIFRPHWWIMEDGDTYLVVSAFLHFPPFATLCKPTTCEILFRETNPKRDKNGTKSQENKIKNASSPTSLVVDFSFLCKGTILSREKQAKSSKYAAYQTFILHVHFQEDTASASCTDLCCLLQRPVKIRFMPFVHYGIAADAHCLGTVYNPSAIICNAEICVPSANW